MARPITSSSEGEGDAQNVVTAAMVLATTEAVVGGIRAEEMLPNCTPIEQAEARDGKTWYTPTYEAGICVGFLGGIERVRNSLRRQRSATLQRVARLSTGRCQR